MLGNVWQPSLWFNVVDKPFMKIHSLIPQSFSRDVDVTIAKVVLGVERVCCMLHFGALWDMEKVLRISLIAMP